MKAMKRQYLFGAAILAAIAVPAIAQMTPASDTSAHRTSQPYDIESFGVFRDMMLKGDFAPKVKLDSALAKHPTIGVGAVAGARGEITIYDGKPIISYGKPGAYPAIAAESAALLVIGTAKDWQVVLVERNIPPQEVDAFIAATAKANRIDPDKSFPFELRGAVAPYAMHVNAAPIDGPHGMGLPMAVTVETKGEEIRGNVAGLYVSADLEGIATHGGERTHAHWVSADGKSTAHLDRWGIKAGTSLMLPKP